jgi:DnaJ family protein C protein 13
MIVKRAICSSQHWTAGEFPGVAHATALLDRVMKPGLRQALLGLLRSLLLPAAAEAGEDRQAAAAAKLNGVAFVEAGGVQLMVDLLAGAQFDG